MRTCYDFPIYTFPDVRCRLLEARLQETLEVDTSRLLDLAFITNKYKYLTTERWATDLLVRHCSDGEGRADFAKSCTQEQLEALIDISIRTERPDLRIAAEQRWLTRLQAGTLSTTFALDVGERFRLRSFLGHVYYMHLIFLCTPKTDSLPVVGSAVKLDIGDLHDIHVQRLQSGFLSLCLTWDAIVNMPFSVGVDYHCPYHGYTHREKRLSHWWEKLIVDSTVTFLSSSMDVLGRLKLIYGKLNKDRGHWHCYHDLFTHLDRLQATVESELPNHFGIVYNDR